MRINRRDNSSSALVTHQEFAAHKGQSLDVALRYAPSFLAKGLVLIGVECIFINGMPKPTLLAKDIAADEVGLVEVYNHRGPFTQDDRRMFGRYGSACGIGPTVEVYGPKGSAMRSFRPPNPAAVAFISIWLK